MSRQLVYAWDFHRNFLLGAIVMVALLVGYCIGTITAKPFTHGFFGYETKSTAHFAQRDYLTLGFAPDSTEPVYFGMTQGSVPHNNDGAGIVEIDPLSGICVSEFYVVGGERHRTDGPAVIYRNRTTGIVEQAEWWRLGRPYTPTDEEVRIWNALELGSQPCNPGKILGGRWQQ